jgi:hypothetical protein
MQLNRVSIGWTWLEQNLNEIIDTVNTNHVVPSADIAVQESPTGTMLKVTQSIPPATQQTGGGSGTPPPPEGTAGWQQINIVDDTCNQYTMWVWGTTPKLTL